MSCQEALIRSPKGNIFYNILGCPIRIFTNQSFLTTHRNFVFECVLSMCCVIVCPVYVLCNSVSCLLLYCFGCDVCNILKIKKSLNFMIKTNMTEINYYLCRCFYTWYICVLYWTVLVVKSCLSLLFE